MPDAPFARLVKRLLPFGLPWRQPPCVQQFSEEDCGAACLATVCRSHGHRLPLSLVREQVGTTAQGTTLLGLRRGAEQLGFHARAAKADPSLLEQLKGLPLPLICHWRGNHWVVLHGRSGAELLVADPAVGLRRLSRQAFLQGWQDGVVLLLEPDPVRFPPRISDQTVGGVSGLAVIGRYVLPFRTLLLQVLLLNLVIGVIALSMPLVMQVLTDDVLVRGDDQMLSSLAIAIVALFFFRALIDLLQGTLVSHFGHKLQLQMLLHYGSHLLQLPLSYFENRRSGEVVSRIEDIQQVNRLIGNLVLGLPGQCCIALVSLSLMLTYSIPLTLAALGGFLLVITMQLAMLPTLTRQTQGMVVQSADNQGFLVELFRAAPLLKTTQATGQAWQQFQRDFGRLSHMAWNLGLLDLRLTTSTGLIGNVTSIALLWYGSSFVISHQLSIGQLLAFNGMGANVLAFLAGLTGITQELVTSRVVLHRLQDVLHHPLEHSVAAGRQQAVIAPDADIVCSAVSFHHPGRVALIEDLDLRIPGGITTALIGESGCGKSTLSKLIAGLYPLDRGSIHYGLFSGRDLSLDCLRRQVVLQPQEDNFMNRSIVDNFLFAYPWMQFDDIVQLCQLTFADAFIRQLPNGYGTVLGETGTNLSGGQRQRLALARALASDPPVLLLDESTSALDPVLETQVMDQLLAHRRGKTTVLISHRPNVILRADWIVFMERGRVHQQNHPNDLRHLSQIAPYLQAA